MTRPTYLSTIPLTRKVLVISFLLCTAVWLVLDHYQSANLRTLFNNRLNQNLQEQAAEDRALLDNYIRSFTHAARIIVSQKNINDYLTSDAWPPFSQRHFTHQHRASWLPKSSLLRSLPFVYYYLLLDPGGMVREACMALPGDIPKPFTLPDTLLRQLSHNQTYLTNVDGKPYLLASNRIHDDHDNLLASLMLITPLDSDFLERSLQAGHRNSLVALVDTNHNTIVASNQPEKIASGTPLDQLSEHYLITGKSYFDYGSSDLQVHFISLLSQKRYQTLSMEILKTDRINRAFTGLAMIVCLISIITYITWHINRLKKEMDQFARQSLGIRPQVPNGRRDQLAILWKRFQDLQEEILLSHDKLKEEAEKNILLAQKNMEMEEKQHLLELLQTVTDEFEIGVLIRQDDAFVPANRKMELFVVLFSGIDTFTALLEQPGEHMLQDPKGQPHVFHISSRFFKKFETTVIFVQEITARKKAEEERERLIRELQEALGKVKVLSGFLPICSSCKKIRDDKGYWNQIELYIRQHSDAEFSHSICPDCFKKLYPGLKLRNAGSEYGGTNE